jgi:ribosomal protein L11 methyltransferase
MDIYVAVTFNIADDDIRDAAAAMLESFGFEGFEEDFHYLKAFMPNNNFDETQLKELLAQAPVMNDIVFTVEEIQPENWNEQWEKNFKPIIIADRLYIHASFHPERKDIPLDIIIDPKMSFGTGHHATTYMMSLLMLETDFSHKTVFDFGSGTGILSILASKLGAESVYALDHEEWAYNNCVENCGLNNVTNIEAIHGDESKFPAAQFDIILANINKNIISKNMAKLAQLLKPDGLLFISGFLTQDIDDLLSLARTFPLARIEQMEKDGWVAMKLCNRPLSVS